MRYIPDYPLIIAHRGDSSTAPENTLAAFRKAVSEGAEGIEFDVRLSKDGVAIVFHDSELKRIADIDDRVSEYTAEQLFTFNVGLWFNLKNPEIAKPEYDGEKIPTLRQTLELLHAFNGVIYIELKCRDNEVRELTQAVCREIGGYPHPERIIVKSFKLNAIPIVRELFPGIKTGALFAPKVKTWLKKEKRLIEIAKSLDCEFISLHFSMVTKKLMMNAERERLGVTIWTVDNPHWVKRSVKLGITHIITNVPGLLLAKRRRMLLNHRDTSNDRLC